jgi:hypothetical protein
VAAVAIAEYEFCLLYMVQMQGSVISLIVLLVRYKEKLLITLNQATTGVATPQITSQKKLELIIAATIMGVPNVLQFQRGVRKRYAAINYNWRMPC